MIRLPLAAVLAALFAIAPTASYAGPGDGAPGPGRAGHGPRAGVAFARMHARMHRQQRKTARLLRLLELSDAQRAIVAEGSALASPVRRDLHAKVRAIFEDAWTSPRTKESRQAIRAKVKATVQAALASLETPARKLLDALTPEQKAKLEAKAKEHGRTFDETKLLRAFEGMLLAPRHGMREHRGTRGAAGRDGTDRDGTGRGAFGRGGFGPGGCGPRGPREGFGPGEGFGPRDGTGPRPGFRRGFRGGDDR